MGSREYVSSSCAYTKRIFTTENTEGRGESMKNVLTQRHKGTKEDGGRKDGIV
jgi:hypothetical protein